MSPTATATATATAKTTTTPPSTTIHPVQYDCSRLLLHVQNAEAAFLQEQISKSIQSRHHHQLLHSDAPVFGHPESPQLQLFRLSKAYQSQSALPLLVVVYTNHCVAAQVIPATQSKIASVSSVSSYSSSHSLRYMSEPMDVCTLLQDSIMDMDMSLEDSLADDEHSNQSHERQLQHQQSFDEVVNCLAILALEDDTILLNTSTTTTRTATTTNTSTNSPLHGKPATTTTTTTTTNSNSGGMDIMLVEHRNPNSPMLAKGVVAQSSHRLLHLAIVIGTSQSHVYSVELVLDPETWMLHWPSALAGASTAATYVPALFDVLPLDTAGKSSFAPSRKTLQSSTQPSHVPFRPNGHGTSSKSNESAGGGAGAGVTNLSLFRIQGNETNPATATANTTTTTHVWVTYADGTIIRLHHAGFFPSVCQRGADQGVSLDVLLKSPQVLWRYMVALPPKEHDLQLVPLPKFHPTLLSPLSSFRYMLTEEEEEEEKEEQTKDYHESSTTRVAPLFETLVYGTTASSDLFPTAVFYTSEKHLADTRPGEQSKVMTTDRRVLDAVMGGTKALVGGMVGTAIGAVRWGLFGGASFVAGDSAEVSTDEMEEQAATSPFPSLWHQPTMLHAGFEYHDAPRRLEFCAVDPDGKYLAATDNLGRVLLLDLATRQVIRMWKGYRQSRCHWLHRADSFRNKPDLYLVIHSRHRNVVESWLVKDNTRISFIQVGRDAALLPCMLWSRTAMHSTCYLVHSLEPGSPENILEMVDVTIKDDAKNTATDTKVTSDHPSSRSAALRLQRLQQLLTTTTVELSSGDVYAALTEVQLGDLATALDLIGETTVLEDKAGVTGSEFQKLAIDYCREKLQDAMSLLRDSNTSTNPHIQALSVKLQYHSQLVKVYDILGKFELRPIDDGSPKTTGTSAHWASEALGWAVTYESITKSPLEALAPTKDSEPIRFSQLFACCVFPQKPGSFASTSGLRIYFSDSSRIRRNIIIHAFRPLLGDIFSLNVVYMVFEGLGIRDDTSYILKCFGEWFMLLSKQDISRGLFGSNSPMTRFLRDLIIRQLGDKDDGGGGIALATLHSFCQECTDLVRAFLLAAICREAVAKTSLQKEKTSYGKIVSRKLVDDWDTLVRRIRVCLLVSLRLHDKKLAAPITIANVEAADIFSVYQWLAQDELSMSRDQEEISLLEKACLISGHAFDPSKPEGDGPSNFKALQNSCFSSQISEAERSEYLVDFDDDDKFGALLLFFKAHNRPHTLAAHRSLLLLGEWLKQPHDLSCLHHSFMALDFLYLGKDNRLTAAVCLEIWKVCASIFRAHLFGWEEIEGIREHIFAPLLLRTDWFMSFGRIALKFLRILRVIEFDVLSIDEPEENVGTTETWPPVKPDAILMRLIGQLYPVNESAVDAHCVVLCALLISRDVAALVRCVPSIYDLFLSSSLGNVIPSAYDVEELQRDFVEEAVLTLARDCPNRPISNFDMQEVETLAHVWRIDPRGLRSLFLLGMYELEKDVAVDDLLTKNVLMIDGRKFIEHGVDIACRRLHAFLNGQRLDTTRRRIVMSQLDADVCAWVQERASHSSWLMDPGPSDIPIERTDLFIARLLNMSASVTVDYLFRTKIQSLVLLCGTLSRELIKYR